MKNIYTLLLCFLPSLIYAQKNFHKLSIGAGGGITNNRGELNSPQNKQLLIGTADYYLTPFLHGGIEAQMGTISGRETSYSRHFQNDFKALILSAKLHLGQFMNNMPDNRNTLLINTVKGVYAGLGTGVIKNSQQQIYRDSNNQLTRGTNNNKEIFVPVSVGIDNSGFHSRLIAGLRYQANYVLGDQLDGYYSAGSRNDFYSNISVTLKYKFGPTGIF